MKLDKFKGLVAGIAPAVGAALGGPFGAVAGQMVQVALGVDDPSKVEAILASGSPETILKLKEAELNFRQWMRDADIREEQLVVQDRADARGLAKALGSSGPQLAIVVALTMMIGWVIYELFLDAPPKGSENVLYIILGQLTTAWTAAISFFVGTTKSSAEKTSLLQAANK